MVVLLFAFEQFEQLVHMCWLWVYYVEFVLVMFSLVWATTYLG